MTIKVQKSVHRTTTPDIIPDAAALFRKIRSGQSFFFSGLTWEEYDALLDELQDRRPRITFDNGRLEVMAKSWLHEAIGALINLFLFTWTVENGLQMSTGGQLTFARRDLAKGLEPDHCYWIANVARLKGKKRLDFRRDPPPDLALEIEVSRTVISRLDIYAALRVPEVWRCTESTIEIGMLQTGGTYTWGAESTALPGFPIKRTIWALRRLAATDQSTLVGQFQAWVREHRETN